MDQSQKADLVISALQQRIGELVTEYETKIAIYRAEITMLQSMVMDVETAKEKYSEQLMNKVKDDNV